jgi:hypothetical protein
LNGCAAWSLLLWEKTRLRVFENRILRKTFGHKRKQVTRNARKLRDVALHQLYSSPDIRRIKSRRMKWTGQVTRKVRTEMGTGFWNRSLKERDYWKILCRWKGYIKINLQENGKKGAGCINLSQNGNKWRPLVNTTMHF